jgi:hypothetical protein
MHEGDEECIHTILVGRPQEKKPLERPSSRWKDNFKIVHREIRYIWIEFRWFRVGSKENFF